MKHIPLEMALACAKWPVPGRPRLLNDYNAPGWLTDTSFMVYVGEESATDHQWTREPPPGIAKWLEDRKKAPRVRVVEDPRYRINPPRAACGGYWDEDEFGNSDGDKVPCPGDHCLNCDGEKLEPRESGQTVWWEPDRKAGLPTIISPRYAPLLEGLEVSRVIDPKTSVELLPLEGCAAGVPLVYVMPLRTELKEPTT